MRAASASRRQLLVHVTLPSGSLLSRLPATPQIQTRVAGVKRRVAGMLSIAVLVATGALEIAGCGGGASSTVGLTSPPGSSIAQVADQHPDVVDIVCRDIGNRGKSVDVEALGYVGPLATDAHVSPSKLLDEFLSRC